MLWVLQAVWCATDSKHRLSAHHTSRWLPALFTCCRVRPWHCWYNQRPYVRRVFGITITMNLNNNYMYVYIICVPTCENALCGGILRTIYITLNRKIGWVRWLFLRLRGFWVTVRSLIPLLRFFVVVCFVFCFLFVFEVEISPRTLTPLFMQDSVHSGSASWDDCCRMFPDKLRCELVSG